MWKRNFQLLAAVCTLASLLLVWWHWDVIAMADQHRPSVLLQQAESTDAITHIHSSMPTESTDTITRIQHSTHLMVSAFKDHRRGGAIRVIGIIQREELQKLYCVLCGHATSSSEEAEAAHQCVSSEAHVDIHSDHFSFPYGTSDILCSSPLSIKETHVSVTTDPLLVQSLEYLPIQNKEMVASFKYNFTVCISNLFGDFNNALQVVQTMEVYKLLGIQQVVIYNTSCGPDVEKVLQHYKKEGMLEVVPWPIDKFLKPSRGWKQSLFPGDIHYYGQIATLNECIYRYMYQSRYLLLNDMDEIIMPYKHASLGHLMDTFQKQHPNVGVFRVENPIFPKTQFDDSGRFRRPEWSSVPGINILEHIYREPDQRKAKPFKMIINPRKVEQTSVHTTLKQFGPIINIPFYVCHIIHVRTPLQRKLHKEQLIKDDKLWEFEEKLIPYINHALTESGLLA